MKQRSFVSLMCALVLVASFAAVAAAQGEPAVRVDDQEVVNGVVTVGRVTSDGPGWIVIYADADGAPGAVIGYAPVQEGENDRVVVEANADAVTPVLHAMLHIDAGAVGTFEYPGADAPAQVEGAVVSASFSSERAAAQGFLRQSGRVDVVDTAAAQENLSTFVAALRAAGLVEQLRGSGPYTLFAPTDAAFQSLPEGTLEGWLSDPAGDLNQVLLNHVASGRVMAADITGGPDGSLITEAETLQGGRIALRMAGGTIQANDATVIAPDIEANNGVIHVIDAVLLPTAAAETASADEEAQPTPQPAEEMAEDAAETAPAAPAATATPGEETAETAPTPTPQAAEEEVGGAIPQVLPVTGVRAPRDAVPAAVVMAVLTLLIGASVLARRRSG